MPTLHETTAKALEQISDVRSVCCLSLHVPFEAFSDTFHQAEYNGVLGPLPKLASYLCVCGSCGRRHQGLQFHNFPALGRAVDMKYMPQIFPRFKTYVLQ